MNRFFENYISDRCITPQTEWFLIKIIWLANFADGPEYQKYAHLSLLERMKIICQNVPSVYKTGIDCGKPIFKLYLKRGELVASLRCISNLTGQTIGTVRGHISQLASMHVIEHASTNVGYIISICDYKEITSIDENANTRLTHLSACTKLADMPPFLSNSINKGINKDINIGTEKVVTSPQQDQFDAPSDKQACPFGGHDDDHIIDKDISDEAKETEKPKRTKKPKAKEKTDGAIIWDHYASAFAAKYKIEPLRNAKGYALSAQLAKLASIDVSRQIIDAYFKTKDTFVLKARHPLGLLISQLDKFRVDNIAGNDLNANTYMQNRKYVPMRLSHDEAWEEDFVDLVSNKWTDIKAFRARNEKK